MNKISQEEKEYRLALIEHATLGMIGEVDKLERIASLFGYNDSTGEEDNSKKVQWLLSTVCRLVEESPETYKLLEDLNRAFLRRSYKNKDLFLQQLAWSAKDIVNED